jgi:hypothetical protein
MRQAVTSNAAWIQEGLFPEFSPGGRAVKPRENGETLVWLLLLKVEGDQLSLELSLPDDIADDGRVESWVRRIPLPPIVLGGSMEVASDDHGEEPDIDIPVTRR